MKTFRDLMVWQQAHDLVLAVYKMTSTFPTHEQYGLTSQMRRSATSIAANIVEGHKRRSQKEFLNFLNIADGSLEELKYYLLLARELRYVSTQLAERRFREAEVVGRMLTRFKAYIRHGAADAPFQDKIPASA